MITILPMCIEIFTNKTYLPAPPIEILTDVCYLPLTKVCFFQKEDVNRRAMIYFCRELICVSS